MTNSQKKSMLGLTLLAAAFSLVIFAGDTVSLRVTRTKSSEHGKWDPVGEDPAERHINVSADGAEVKLIPKTVKTITNIGCADIRTDPDSSAACNTTCTIEGADTHHKLHRRGKYTIKGEGTGGDGDGGELVWNASGRTEGGFYIDPFDSVRRRYGDDEKIKDPGEITMILIKGEKDVKYDLKIETLSGKGKAAFDKDGKTEEVYNGKGEEESIPLYGIEESTEEHNIKITGSKDGKMLDEQKFIVFSEVKYAFSSPITKHKDTNAPCKHCDVQGGFPPEVQFRRHAHDEDGDNLTPPVPCDHVAYYDQCVHCRGYCFRCCMKHICGGNQDDYVVIREDGSNTTVEENHFEWLDAGSAQMHSKIKGKPISIFQNPSYKTAYEKLLAKKRFIGGRGSHAEIIHALRFNRPDGTVDRKNVKYWTPITASGAERSFTLYGEIYPEK